MNQITMYQASVPVFETNANLLNNILEKSPSAKQNPPTPYSKQALSRMFSPNPPSTNSRRFRQKA